MMPFQRPNTSGSSINFAKLALAAIVIAPSLVLIVFHTSSLAYGLLFVLFLVLSVNLLVGSVSQAPVTVSTSFILFSTLVVTGLIFHYELSLLLTPLQKDFRRFVSSAALVPLILLAVMTSASYFAKMHAGDQRRVLMFVSWILAINALVSLTGNDFLKTGASKPAFLFSEPSHLALSAAPFLVYYVKLRLKGWQLLLLIFTLFAILIQNLTMVVAIILAMLVAFKFKRSALAVMVLASVIGFSGGAAYFLNRMTLSIGDSSNLSLLVFFQGWENAIWYFKDTFGIGAGFQQFGVTIVPSAVSELLMSLNGGSDLNRFDGGTTAVKIIGEFGVLGIIIILLMLKRAFVSFRILKAGTLNSDCLIFSSVVDCCIMIELFIRGVGYFSPLFFLYIAFFLNRNFGNKQ